MEQQIAELVDQVRLLRQQAEYNREIQHQMEQRRAEDLQRTVELQQQVINAKSPRERATVVDVKGVGRPSSISSETRQFSAWAFNLGNFLEGVQSGMKEALEWAQDQDGVLTDIAPVKQILGEGSDPADTGRQLYAVPASLDLAQHVTRKDGWEAWRIISRRFDPQGAGRRCNVMSQLLQPGSYEPKDLNSAIAKWEEKVRLYERRSQTKLPDDIKSSILTEMCKRAVKEHLVLNAAKLRDYGGVSEEIQCYLGNH